MSDSSILLERANGYAVVTLNRPAALNAFDAGMHDALRRVLAEVAAEPALRALVLTGAGRGFCTGQDLAERYRSLGGPIDLGASIEASYNPLVRRIRSLAIPVVCAVNGVAAGAGANIALACDIVLAARSARFIQGFCRLGLIPDSGGTFVLPRLVGGARARGLALLGEPLDAEQAERWGLIWRAVDDDALMAEARGLAARLAALPATGLALIKRALDASFANDLDAQLDLERDLQREAGQSRDYRDAVAAFVEKRPRRPTGA